MIIFLKIIAGCAIAIVLLIGIAVLLIRQFLKDAFNDPYSNGNPLAIHLNEDIEPDWIDSEESSAIKNELITLGFNAGMAYTIPEMPGVKLSSFFNGEFTAVIMGIPDIEDQKNYPNTAKYFCEIAFKGTNRQEVTYSNQPYAALMDMPPHKKIVRLDIATPTELFDAIKKDVGQQPGIQLSNQTFRAAVEASFREDTMHTNSGGGMTLEQFQQVADDMKKKPKPKDFEKAFETLKASELDNWNQAAVDLYYESIQSSDDESTWDYRYFIVPYNCHRRALLQHLSDMDLVDEEKVEQLNDSLTEYDNGLDLFKRINGALSPELRATPVKPVEFPVKAELFRVAF